MLSIFTDAPDLDTGTERLWIGYGPRRNATVTHSKGADAWRVEIFAKDDEGLLDIAAEFTGKRALAWILDNDGMTFDAPAVSNRSA